MKHTTQMHKHWSWSKAFMFFGCVAVFALLATACGNKGGGSTTATTPKTTVVVNPTPQCTGCPAKMAIMTGVISRQYESSGAVKLEFDMNIYGDLNILGQVQNPANAYTGQQYQGPYAVNGYLTVVSSSMANLCGVPPGRYVLKTVSPGMWSSSNYVVGLSATATGNGRTIQIAFGNYGWTQSQTPQQLGLDGKLYPNTLVTEAQLMAQGAFSPCYVVLSN